MKNIRYILIICLLSVGMSSCTEDVLDLNPLTSPTDATFFSNEAELELGLTGAYRSLYWLQGGSPAYQLMDNATDMGFNRGGVGGYDAISTGAHSSTTGAVTEPFRRMYEGIGRANNLLQNMDRAADNTSPDRFNEIKAEALFLRAYYYHWLTELYGDVPYRTELASSLDGIALARTEKATIVSNILSDLEEALKFLPDSWGGGEAGRATKGAANTLIARIALYNGDYGRAANAAQAVINGGVYSLNPDYEKLFSIEGARSEEVIFDIPFQEGFATHGLPRRQGTRYGGWSQLVPSQEMVDSYECVDGLPIDESPLFDPANPFENRDPRLDKSIVRPGAVFSERRFETHSDSLETDIVEGGVVTGRTANLNAATPNASGANRFSAFTGYIWRKFTSEADLANGTQDRSGLSIIVMRLAEAHLIYAEAKIEQGSIDQTVLDALNTVRARGYGVDVGAVDQYPAITTTDQTELRRIVRRERKIELANEGFRLVDIRRWRIAEKVMPGNLYGSPANGFSDIGGNLGFIPQIDEDGHVTYDGAPSAPRAELGNLKYREVEFRIFNPARDYLYPIPQSEIDAGGGLVTQNPGY